MFRTIATLALALSAVACADAQPQDEAAAASAPELAEEASQWDGIIRCRRADIAVDLEMVVLGQGVTEGILYLDDERAIQLDGDAGPYDVELTEIGGDAFVELTFETLDADDAQPEFLDLVLHEADGQSCRGRLSPSSFR